MEIMIPCRTEFLCSFGAGVEIVASLPFKTSANVIFVCHLKCLTEHPGFKPVCLQKWSLRLAAGKNKTKGKRKMALTPFCCFTRVFEVQFMLCYKEEF